MSRIYDNWERIVGAVLLREQLRQTALCHSSSPSCSISSSTSSSFRLSVGSPHHDISVDFQQTFGDTIQLASQCIADDDDWERLLPLDYQEIVSRSVSPLNYATRKELYLKLCDFPILIDGGEMSFVLDKETGKKCFMIGGKGLKISPGAAPYWEWTPSWHWEWTSCSDSRFSKVIELKSVWWLDVKGKIKGQTLTPKTTYAAYLVFKLAKRYEGLELATAIIRFVNESGGDDTGKQSRIVHLQPPRKPGSRQTVVIRRDDGWMEVEMGSFYVHEGEEREVEAQLLETRRWQTGLIIEGIEFRPVACLSN